MVVIDIGNGYSRGVGKEKKLRVEEEENKGTVGQGRRGGQSVRRF